MKIDKVSLLVLLLLVAFAGGSVGYAIKPEPFISQISYEESQEACVRAMHMMEGINRKYKAQTKTKKEIALERMMNN